MGFNFGDASHDLSYTDIKATFPQFGFVEFQKVNFWTLLWCCLGNTASTICFCWKVSERRCVDFFQLTLHSQGGSSGIVRFKSKDALESSLKLADESGKVSVSGVPATVSKLEGVPLISCILTHSHSCSAQICKATLCAAPAFAMLNMAFVAV